MTFKCPVILLAILIGSGPWQVHATCNSAIIPDTPDNRYIDNQDGTITDTRTDLMWSKCSGGLTGNDCSVGAELTYTLSQALRLAKTINNNDGFAGYTDWRLPNINELASLVEFQCVQPAINLNLFPATQPSGYWSSSQSVNDTLWFLDFRLGEITSTTNDTNIHHVRLVRGGP